MSKIKQKFEELKNNNKKALIPYITGGDPNYETTLNLILGMEAKGADIIQIGIAYSDPLADGVIIQKSSERALKAGANIDLTFDMISKARKKTQIPLVVLAYFNSIYKYGIKKFFDKCDQNLIDGIIIPDLPIEERMELQDEIKDYDVDLIALVAQTSQDRIKKIVSNSTGFVYCISSNENLSDFINTIRQYTDNPLVLGFEESIDYIKDFADGVMLGSTIVQKVEEGINENDIVDRVLNFVEKLNTSLKK